MTMHSLGVALLEVGFRKLIDSYDVLQARKLAARPTPLGPKYRELTEKCLDCDFGVGKDFSNPQLQHAVYDSVVCELDSMIASLDISRD